MKISIFYLFQVAILVGLMSGCTSQFGNPRIQHSTNTSVSQEIQPNITSQQYVIQLYGEPSWKSAGEDGKDIWGWQFAERSGGKQHGKLLKIYFTQNSLVESFELITDEMSY